MKRGHGGSHRDDSPGEPAHTPVLWREILRFLEVMPLQDGILVDCTLGEGGHSELILNRFKTVRVIGIERDGAIMKLAEKRLGRFRRRIRFIEDNFSNYKIQYDGDFLILSADSEGQAILIPIELVLHAVDGLRITPKSPLPLSSLQKPIERKTKCEK